MLHHDSETDPNRIPNRTSKTESHERTNERTNVEVGSDRSPLTVEIRGRAYSNRRDEPEPLDVALGEFIDQWELMLSQVRWPVVRSGERAPIAPHLRAAVWYRDSGRCAICIAEMPRSEVMHLDHIIPWSAGGSDTSENLRLLCEVHNLERSNYVDFARQQQPVTWWCHRCYGQDSTWSYYRGGYVECPTHRNQERCRVARAYRRAWATDPDSAANWHMRSALATFPHHAYCAHCNAPGLTSVLL